MASTTATKETITRAVDCCTEEEPLEPVPLPLPPAGAVGWEAAIEDMEAMAGARSVLLVCEAAGV